MRRRKYYALVMADEEFELLRGLADRDGLSKAGVLRQLLHQEVERRRRQDAQFAREVVADERPDRLD